VYVTSHIQNVPLSVPFVTKDFVPNDVAWDLSKLIIHFHFCVLCMHAVCCFDLFLPERQQRRIIFCRAILIVHSINIGSIVR